MYSLHVEREIACSHILNLHDGKCHNLHGHNYKIVVDITTDKLIEGEVSSDGMVVDFGLVKGVIDDLDHKHLNEYFEILEQSQTREGTFTKFLKQCAIQPTSERLSRFIAVSIYDKVYYITGRASNINVKVYESSTNYAEFSM